MNGCICGGFWELDAGGQALTALTTTCEPFSKLLNPIHAASDLPALEEEEPY